MKGFLKAILPTNDDVFNGGGAYKTEKKENKKTKTRKSKGYVCDQGMRACLKHSFCPLPCYRNRPSVHMHTVRASNESMHRIEKSIRNISLHLRWHIGIRPFAHLMHL